MSDPASRDDEKPIEILKNDQSDATGEPSASTDGSDKTSTQPKNLSDMPIHVVALIIERSEYREQLLLRTVSKSLRELVDNQKPACESIKVNCSKESITITFSDEQVVYSDDEDYDRTKGLKDFEKFAFDHLASTLKNPKLELEDFTVFDYFLENEEHEKYCNELQRILGSLNHQVSVKRFEIMLRSTSWLLSTLPHLKPGVLEKISLYTFRGDQWRAGMDQVALLDQWKQAKELDINTSFDRFPMEYATHFKRFRFTEGNCASDKFIRIRDYLSKLENFEQCTLSWSCIQKPDIVSQVLGQPVSSNATEEVFHYSIPNSDYYLEFKKATRSIDFEITKKKKREGN